MVTNNAGNIPTGASGTVLQGQGVGTAPAFSTPTYPSASGSAGKILISDGTNNIYSTPTYPNTSGSAGTILVSDGTNNVYSTPTFPNASATARKIIVSDGTNWVASTETYAVPGSSGNLMTSDGTNWTSAAPAASSSAFVLIQTQTPSGVVSVAFTTGISSTYNSYQFIFTNVSISGADTLAMVFSSNGGSSYITSGYINYDGSTTSRINMGTLGGAFVFTGFSEIFGAETAHPTTQYNNLNYAASGSIGSLNTQAGQLTGTTTVNAFKFFTVSGSTITGTISLYGYTH